MRDLKALSQTIVEAMAALPPQADANERCLQIEPLIEKHFGAIAKSISGVGDFADLLRDLGFAKAAVRKLSPAFKSLATGDEDLAQQQRRDTLQAILDSVRSAKKTVSTENGHGS